MRTALIAILLAGPTLTSATELTGRELTLLRIVIRQRFQSDVHAAHRLDDEEREDRVAPLGLVSADPNVVEQLHSIMTDETGDPYKRFNAARALAYLGDQRCIDILSKTLAGEFAGTSSCFELSEAALCLLYLGYDFPDDFLFTRVPNRLYPALNVFLEDPNRPAGPLSFYPERYDFSSDPNLPYTKEQVEQVVAQHFGWFSAAVSGPLLIGEVEQRELQQTLDLIAAHALEDVIRAPFPGRYSQWEDFEKQARAGGLIYYITPGMSPSSVMMAGYVLIRDGRVVAQIMTIGPQRLNVRPAEQVSDAKTSAVEHKG